MKTTTPSRCASGKARAITPATGLAALLLAAVAQAVGGTDAAGPQPATGQPTAGTALPAEAFGRLPLETDAVLSPDGHWLAWIDHAEVRPRVVMFDIPGRKVQRILAVPERSKLRNLVWSDNETLLITVSQTLESEVAARQSRENWLTIAQDVSGGNGRMLPRLPTKKMAETSVPARIIRARTPKPKTVVMMSAAACDNCLIEVNTTSGDYVGLKSGTMHTTGWVTDVMGKPIAREDWDWMNHAYRVYALSSGNDVREILRNDDAHPPRLAGGLPDDSALVLLASNGHPHQAAWALPLDGSPTRLLFEDPDADVTATYADPYTGAIIG